ncbi:energy transducer TonB [Flagellimonas sp. 2504JD4-2]
MELKKNPKLELKKNSTLYFLIGLTVILLLAYVAVEWKSYYKTPEIAENLGTPDVLEEILPPVIKLPPPPPPPKIQAPPIIEVVPDDEEITETVIESNEPDQDTEIMDVEDVDFAEEPIDEIIHFEVIEDVPVFPGCEVETSKEERKACFEQMLLKHIRRTFRYPEIAQEMGVQGRVHMRFIIQKDGSIGNVEVMRSPDKNLSKEATRIISKLPKMTPGKQRGTPVKVPFSIPITFKLQ